MKTKVAYLGLVLLAALCACLNPSISAHQAQTNDGKPPAGSPLPLTCSPDKPTVWPRETINVRAWVDPLNGQTRFAWTATGGRIGAPAAETTWDFTDVEPGTYTATVRVTNGAVRTANCTVHVVVHPPSNIRGRESGWHFLISGRTEEKDYGLYSYLLLGAPPGDASRERYRRAIEAYVGLIPDIAGLEQYVTRRQLNITYLPLTSPPSPGPVPLDWVLEHYDYARARALLSKLPGDHRDGPYIISMLGPMTGATAAPARYLFQDLSRTPPHLVTLWVKEFFNQAAQERFWEEPTARGLALKLRTTIAILALGLPDVPKTLEDSIAWMR